jgi:hypothetical protein
MPGASAYSVLAAVIVIDAAMLYRFFSVRPRLANRGVPLAR